MNVFLEQIWILCYSMTRHRFSWSFTITADPASHCRRQCRTNHTQSHALEGTSQQSIAKGWTGYMPLPRREETLRTLTAKPFVKSLLKSSGKMAILAGLNLKVDPMDTNAASPGPPHSDKLNTSHHRGAKICQNNAPEINRYTNETHGTLCGSRLTAPKNHQSLWSTGWTKNPIQIDRAERRQNVWASLSAPHEAVATAATHGWRPDLLRCCPRDDATRWSDLSKSVVFHKKETLQLYCSWEECPSWPTAKRESGTHLMEKESVSCQAQHLH